VPLYLSKVAEDASKPTEATEERPVTSEAPVALSAASEEASTATATRASSGEATGKVPDANEWEVYWQWTSYPRMSKQDLARSGVR